MAVKVSISGSLPTILSPLFAAWQAALARHDPGLTIAVPGGAGPPQGALDSNLAAFLDGRRDFAFLTREIAEDDLRRFRIAHATDPVIVPVAGGSPDRFGYVDPVVVIVNAANPIRRFDLAQLDAIFSISRWRGRAAITDWGQAGVPGWRGRPIVIVGGDAWATTESARALTIRRHVLSIRGRRGVWRPAPGTGSEADNVERVARDPFAIGFTGAGHVLPGTRIVPVAPGPGVRAIAPTRAAVAAGRYPLARTVDLLMARRADGTIDTGVVRFARFLTGPAGQAVVAAEGPFLPLTPRQVAASRRTIGC